ncbi:MAG: hypothetical protein OXC31_21875 [Spirochaetaceae bacterium]|nr:hypothetical protein [Spirochaetaceae bacterium]
MTELLERAIAKLQDLPSDLQDEAAELLLDMVERSMDAQLTPDQAQEVARRLEAPAGYATHEEVAAFFGHDSMG